MASPSDTETTIDYSITWDTYRSSSDNGDFARLIPHSPLARAEFNRLAGLLSQKPDMYPHQRRLVHWDPTDSEVESASEPETPSSARHRDPFCGYYRLNMQMPPKVQNIGWVMGSGRVLGASGTAVDLQLTCLPGSHRVRGNHCRLWRDLHSGLLSIVSDGRPVMVGARTLQRRARDLVPPQSPTEYQMFLHGDTLIQVGDLSYVLVFTALSPTVQEDELRQARASMGDLGAPKSVFVSPTPLADTFEYYGYVLYSPTRGGAASSVCVGYSKSSGDIVAVKKTNRTSRSKRQLANEIDIMRCLQHPNLCALVEVIDPHDPNAELSPTMAQEIAFVLSPAGTCATDYLYKWHHIVSDRQLFLSETIRQVAAGLAYMHAETFMHCDIKPDNLAFVFLDPVKVVILDFGHSVHGSSSSNHMLGTLTYLAPEIMQLKDSHPALHHAAPFSFPVDIWALGVTLMEFLTGGRLSRYLGKESQREWLHATLEEKFQRAPKDTREFWRLARECLSWDAESRPSASQIEGILALESKPFSSESKNRARKRSKNT